MRFDEFGFDPALMLGIRDMRYQDATPIQEQAIPAVLAGKDVIGLAQTGTGKTAAFLLPILQRVMPGHTGATRALILAPTRELASQIDDVRVGLTYHTAVSGALVLGGANADIQERALKAVPDIVIATPGRLLDFLFRNLPKLDKIEILVLDEADRMLDMGFLPDIEKILRRLPEKRQNLMFSATMPPPIEKLAREIMRDPVAISIGARSRPVEKIRHIFERVQPHYKTRRLVDALRDRSMESVIVFTKTKSGADRLWRDLVRSGVHDSVAIHGDRSQQERFQALELFKSRQIRVLIATDVAARGIDVDSVSHVVNFDLPRTFEDYVHRVGRTARAGESGIAVTLVTPEEERAARRYEQSLDAMRAKSRQQSPAESATRPERTEERALVKPSHEERHREERPARREPVAPRAEVRRDEARPPRHDAPRDSHRERPRDDHRRHETPTSEAPRDRHARDDRRRDHHARSERPRDDRRHDARHHADRSEPREPRHETPRHDEPRRDEKRHAETRHDASRHAQPRRDERRDNDSRHDARRHDGRGRDERRPPDRHPSTRHHADRPKVDQPNVDRPHADPSHGEPHRRQRHPEDRHTEDRKPHRSPAPPPVASLDEGTRRDPPAQRPIEGAAKPETPPKPASPVKAEGTAKAGPAPSRHAPAAREPKPVNPARSAPSVRDEAPLHPVATPGPYAAASPKKKVAKKVAAAKKPRAAPSPRAAAESPTAAEAASKPKPAKKAKAQAKASPKKRKSAKPMEPDVE